jgi:hypothetical protein
MKYQLVLQWPVSSIQDYDAMIAAEDALIYVLPEGSEVDGHDAGSGEVNIFIHTNAPAQVFDALKPTLADSGLLASARAAFREQSQGEYIVLWPKGLETFKVT